MAKGDFAIFAGNLMIESIGLGIIASALLIGGSFVVSGLSGFGAETGVMLRALALAVLAVLLREYARRLFFQRLELLPILAMDTGVAVLQLTFLVSLQAIGHLSPATAYLSIGGAAAIAVSVLGIFRRDAVQVDLARLSEEIGYGWRIGKWVLASGTLWTLGMHFYPWVLAYFHGAEAAGIRGACVGVTAIASVPMLGIQNVLGPEDHAVAGAGRSGGSPEDRQTFAVRFPMLMVLPFLVLVVAGGRLVTLLYGAPYGGDGLEVALIAGGTIPSGCIFRILAQPIRPGKSATGLPGKPRTAGDSALAGFGPGGRDGNGGCSDGADGRIRRLRDYSQDRCPSCAKSSPPSGPCDGIVPPDETAAWGLGIPWATLSWPPRFSRWQNTSSTYLRGPDSTHRVKSSTKS